MVVGSSWPTPKAPLITPSPAILAPDYAIVLVQSCVLTKIAGLTYQGFRRHFDDSVVGMAGRVRQKKSHGS